MLEPTSSPRLLALLGMALLTGCATFAPPSPLVTFGGPQTTPKGDAELGVASGAAMADHGSGSGIFARYKRGVSDRFDLGVDAIMDFDHTLLSAKLAMRYQLEPRWRLEWGVGAADSAEGKSLNADLGITFGTRADRPWNWYTTLRVGAAKGDRGNIVFDDHEESEPIAPADAVLGMLSFGAQARLGAQWRLVFEGGMGTARPRHQDSADLYYLTAALLFDVGGR